MKQRLRLFSTLLLLAVVSAAWGETTETLTISSYASSSSWENQTQYLTASVGNVTFNASGGSNTGKYYSTDNTWRFYANENAKLTISVPDGNTLVSVTPTFTTKDNGTVLFGTNTCESGIAVNVSGTSAEFTISQSSGNKGKVFFTAIAVTYTTSGGNTAVATTTTIDDSGINNTDVHLGTAAGSLTASVTTGGTSVPGATVTWSGNNNDVATIDASTGTVTLVAAGSVTFTANYAGVSGQYKASADTYEMTVTNSAPYVQPTNIEITPNYTFWGKTAQFSGDTFSELTGEKDNVALAWTRGNGSTYANQSAMRFYKDNTLTFTAPQGYEIKSITLDVSGTFNDLAFSPSGFDSESKTWSGSSATVTMSRPSNASSYSTISKFTITIGLPSTEPAISAHDVNLAFDATSGSLTYTLTNAVDGGVMTAKSSETWLTVGTPTDGNVALTFAANSEPTPRTATVTLTYTYNGSETVTKAVTVTQAAVPVSYTTIPDLFNAATSTATDVNVTFGNWIVSGVSTNGKNVYVTDGTNGFVIFDNAGGLNETYSVGSVLSGTAVPCKLVLYNGFAELTNIEVDKLTIAGGGNVTVADITLANLAGVNTGALVSYENLTCSVVTTSNGHTNYFLSDGTTDIQVYNSLYAFDALEAGKQYNITGVYQQFNSKKEILPRNAEDIEEVAEPSVVPATTSVSVNSEEHTGSIAVTVNNAPDALFEVEWCNASGDAAEYDWITAGRNGDVIEYAIQENTTTEARTAYLRAFIMYNDEKISSDLITVTQAGVVVDYATLPYSYDGTGAMINEETGLTESGVGSNNSKPSIKFDTTGDFVVLKMNEAPKALYFDIKGNPGSGTSTEGTFKVQTSADGITYTDLETYTNKDNTLQTEMFVNFASEVRFIKWIYVEKKSGNIALGNIIATNVAPETVKVSISSNATGADGAYYSSVYYSDKALVVPAEVECQTYKMAGGELTVSKTYAAGSVVPAGQAVVIKASDSDEVTFTVTPQAGEADAESQLLGVDAATTITETGFKYYKLTLNANKDAGTAGFYFDKNSNGGTQINAAANKCYLRIPAAQAAKSAFVFGEETTGINAVSNEQMATDKVYNLSGQRVQKATKGIYIVNGKKVVVK